MTEKAKRIRNIGFDLDGTLAEYDGWKGEEVIGKPIAGMRELCLELHERGHHLFVISARARTPAGFSAIAKWLLVDNDFPPMEIWAKPPISVYIDDSSMTFVGSAPFVEEIEGFESWYKDKECS